MLRSHGSKYLIGTLADAPSKRDATVAQSLAVTYFAANEIGKTAVTIKKTTKSK